MNRFIRALTALLVTIGFCVKANANTFEDPVDYVNVLMGTQSEFRLSNGNTYPAIARPWGMNFWTPQTRNIGDGWQYVYTDDKIRGFKQTHQPSPWMNDYGQFSIFPSVGSPKFAQDDRASWFSHKAEKAKPYYYSVYLADYDITTEITPTDRSAIFRFTFPESDSAYVLVDAFDRGSSVEILPEKNAIIGYTTRNSGGVPKNFKNYFVVVFDRPFSETLVVADGEEFKTNELKSESKHSGAFVGFKTKRGEQIIAKVASSFISYEQAWQNLKEVADKDFDAVASEGRDIWNDVLEEFKSKVATSINNAHSTQHSIEQYFSRASFMK
jgi:predicted alpha-1,2-mannosidase